MAETAKRIDPSSRRVDGSIDDDIVNKDPNRHYVLANPNDEDTGLEMYLGLGYEQEVHRKDGPRFRGAREVKMGGVMTRRGQALVSCPLDEHITRITEGQHRADALMASIRSPGGVDGIRHTADGRPVGVQNVEEQLTVRS